MKAIVLALAAICIVPCSSRADESRQRDIPPLIVERPKRPTPNKLEPKHVPPPDAGMCEEPLVIADHGMAQTLMAALLEEPATPEERAIVYAQIDTCKRSTSKTANPEEVLALLRYESLIGVPDEVRGILGATWCIEAAFRLESYHGGPVRGDPRDGVRMASGPFQLWPWQRAWCGFGSKKDETGGADDLFAAASCYWARVEDRFRARVEGKSCNRPWVVAEALGANGPKYLPYGCTAESKHHKELERWRVTKD